jgi:hypothetical protein
MDTTTLVIIIIVLHLVSRKGLRRLAGARRKVHLSAGQHVHELQTAARGYEVKRDEFSRKAKDAGGWRSLPGRDAN